MKIIKCSLIIPFFLLIVLSGFKIAEDPHFLESLKSKLAIYNNTYPEEKIYLQFDKPFYKPGEDIWFNAFILNSNTHKASQISDVLYVELIDPKGNVSSQLSLLIKEGSAHGDFLLQENVPGGLYRVRAFTQWMKNFGKENAFEKEIQIQRSITPRLLLKLDYEKESYGPRDTVKANLNISNLKNEKVHRADIRAIVTLDAKKIALLNYQSDGEGKASVSFTLPDSLQTTDGLLQVIVTAGGATESISRAVPIILNKISLQFFPEGGHWVANSDARIAFKAINEFGKGADVSGDILDEKGNIVTKFESFHMGMGGFSLKSLPEKKYFAKINIPVGNQKLFALPPPIDWGFTLQLKTKSRAVVTWTIYSPIKTYLYLVGQSHGEIRYASKIDVAAGINTIETPTEKFPAGIGVFTLFDPQGIEHCERLVFLNEEKGLNIEISTDKKQYAPREKVELKIKTTNKDGGPIAAKVALAVADDQLISFADDKQDNILSSMLLSSEVHGEIQEPSFYFDASEPKASQALDFLLMTQGWRRFTWKNVKEASKAIVYTPEKVTTLSGQIIHNGVGIQTQITMLELGNKRRIEKLQTTANGHFLFRNIDPTIPTLLLTKRPGEIAVQKEESFSIVLNDKDKTVLLPVQVVPSVPVIPSAIEKETSLPEDLESSDMDLTLVEDVTSLSEVVVTGYGYENKRDLAASIATVSDRDIDSKLPSVALENLLQGRVAGVVVQSQSGNSGASSVIRMRGYSSLSSGRSEPLYVVDGFPMGTSLNQNFANTGIIGPEDIQSVEVIASPEATSLYGCAAANGVILITTKSNIGHTSFKTTRKLSKYNGQTIYPRKYSATREFYVAKPSKNKTQDRKDFRTTLYWNHNIVTNEQGEAQLSFYNNDATSAFRITAEGFSHSGLIGRTETTYFTQLPLALDTKLPEFLGFEDTLRLPISIRNETMSDVSGEITLRFPNELSIQESNTKSVRLKAHSAQTYTFTITTKSVEGEFPISINLTTPEYTDKIDHKIRVQPIGFPARISFSSRDMDKTMQFKVDGAERGTIKAELTAFPDVISDLFAGAEAILQEPHGCFEQVSSSTFPNILALQFLKRSGDIRPEVEKRALRYIEDGYKKLAAYEIRDGGFEWFGHPPAHEGLTAYGLLEFHEMKKVFPKVSDAMMNRTRDWLLSRRNGKGGFKVNRGKYGFAGASEAVSNAYIVYALAETGTKEITPEYLQALAEALESEDMYRMALMACASHTLEKTEQYTNLIDLFKQKENSIGLPALRSDHSIVRSYGQSLLIETVSLWTIALLKSPDFDRSLAAECIKFIVDNRRYGYFGSTQGTTLALMALTEYAKAISLKREDGEILILVNNKVSETAAYNKHVQKQITLSAFSGDIKRNGHQQVRVQFHGTSEPLPYSVNIQWYTKKPQSNDRCKVSISAELKQSTVQLNESVRLSTTLTNKTAEGLPMVTAVVGIPAGLSVQPWQLKELQERNVFDFYEIHNGNLVLYYREMGPEAKHVINLDLKAEMPGKFTGAASSVYLYYASEFKSWTDGNSISIY